MTFVDDNHILFHSGCTLSDYLRQSEQSITHSVNNIPEDQFIYSDDEKLVEHVVSQHTITPIELYEDRMVADQKEGQVDVSNDRSRVWGDEKGPVYVPSLEITLRIPYTGNHVLWDMKPSSWSTTFPRGNILPQSTSQPGELIIVINLPSDVGVEEFQRLKDDTLKDVRYYLSNQKNEINKFNAKLEQSVQAAVKSRRDKLQSHGNILEKLNLPIEPRKGSPIFEPIPIKKIIVPLPPVTKGSQKVEYGITEDIYQHILKVIRHEGRSWEASPKTYAMHDEEELRDIILSHLNTHFEGKATAETFRQKGRTDIRIEADNRAAFVAECKVWAGPKALEEALEQLLGYLTWRDCKASLVIFNKNVSGFSSIVQKIPETLGKHEKLKRNLFDKSDAGEWRYVFKSLDDEEREVIVHVFIFNIFVP